MRQARVVNIHCQPLATNLECCRSAHKSGEATDRLRRNRVVHFGNNTFTFSTSREPEQPFIVTVLCLNLHAKQPLHKGCGG